MRWHCTKQRQRKIGRRGGEERLVVAFVSRVRQMKTMGGWETGDRVANERFKRNGRLNNWRGRKEGREGGRVSRETPVGRHLIWINKLFDVFTLCPATNRVTSEWSR